MIRVAWVVPNTREWIGGLHYFRNLLGALFTLENRRVEPVIVGSAAALPAPFDRCPTIPAPCGARPFLDKVRDNVGRRFLDNGGLLARELRRQNIGLLSHAAWLGRRSPVPALCWIPDFQHRHLPLCFDKAECRDRDVTQKAAARHAQAVVLSSEAARRDFERLYPKARCPVHVLRFVAHAPDPAALPPADEVLARHGIDEPFFHIPNQVWAHKNHAVVIEALGLLAGKGRPPLVVSTGRTSDYRRPEHFASLAERLRTAGLADRLRFLGLIPYAEAAVLMRTSLALINPSFFEGWSTTVEEAKSLGKRILLSDIAVHREQNPARGMFFDPTDPARLAAVMAEVLETHNLREERAEAERAAAETPGRLRRFAEAYEEIVLDVVDRHGRARSE
ncbi:MAG: glycosyltransferase family 4 protein [Thermodesulfobacteriota bacterium]